MVKSASSQDVSRLAAAPHKTLNLRFVSDTRALVRSDTQEEDGVMDGAIMSS